MNNEKQNERRDFYMVYPTAPTPQKGTAYTDICLTNLFAQHLQMLNVEKQLIWQRFSAMLIANSVVFTFLGLLIRDTKTTPSFYGVIPLICLGGLILCIFWLLLTIAGWDILNKRLREAQKFSWNGYNGTKIAVPRWDWIRSLAEGVILVFVAGYFMAIFFV